MDFVGLNWINCAALVILFCASYLLFRIVYLGWRAFQGQRKGAKERSRGEQVRTSVVLGSGGHTAEMIRLMEVLDRSRYSPRLYFVAATDKNSMSKAESFEGVARDWAAVRLPRAREVGQPWLSSAYFSAKALASSLPKLISFCPDLLLVNGPGTSVPPALAAFFLNALHITDTRIVFIESICRVNSLSLSARLLLFVADEILVQWPQLVDKYPRTKYIGRL